MNTENQTVMIRLKDGVITCRLEFIHGRAYAVLYEFVRKGSDKSLCDDKMELEVKLLQPANPTIHGVNYIYGKEMELPKSENN
jgi:hypothetical protein